ncbi:MAG: hypothetical protein IJU37_07075 [Desulfovibrio sp.]|nr:hypothetical protein [Desulfovibrio sp.]
MSQHSNEAIQTGMSPPEYVDTLMYDRDLALIERYLAVLEDNRKACRADLTDADMALDMAGFVSHKLRDSQYHPCLSTPLMALALVRRVPDAPQQ